MHTSCTDRPMYTGARTFPFAGPMMGHHTHSEPHGFCHSCCHPRNHCMCGRRECRKEAKELLVIAEAADTTKLDTAGAPVILGLMRSGLHTNADTGISAIEKAQQLALGTAFIGGGCCVHLSIEYAANVATQAAVVAVMVADSEGTTMLWSRTEPVGAHYQIKEGIMTTKPGAKLTVIVVNATARVRWCEVFSC